ncbi:retrovirus-related Pol polyprotein from transposon 297 [Trichonephila clavipes]|nr:retrovirus-related Pol polyprotein from transposon 297 [Trichonephila clavipes]
MPFGLCNAPATFERLVETVLGGLSYEACLVYLDDIIIMGRFFEEHLKNIRRVLQKLKEANLKLSHPSATYSGVKLPISDTSFLQQVPLHKVTEAKPKSAPILAYPEIGKQFILDTDASHESIGAVLSQEIDGQERVITYFRKCLSKPERKFLLRTDHASLTWLLSFKNSEGQIARWIQRLQEYDVEIRHRKGSAHGNADAFSRRPCPESCKYCSRIEKKFGIIGPIVCQVTTPSKSALDPWSDESARKDQFG